MAKYIMSCANSAETQYNLNWGYLNKPYVVYQEDTQQIDFNSLSAQTPTPYFTQYLTMTSQNDFSFGIYTMNGYGRNVSYEYSVDGGNWTTIQYGSSTPSFSGGSVVRLRGNIEYISQSDSQQGRFDIAGSNVHVYGNILSLIYGDDFTTNIEVPDYCFAYTFWNCVPLTSIENLVLPAMSTKCYMQMFTYCINLTDGRCILPMKQLTTDCYNQMFQGCNNLVQAPSLPATTLAENCYYQMFQNCSSLTTAPALPATTLANKCYYQMFQGCNNLVQAPALPATTLASNCYSNMFRECTSLTTAPELPATTLPEECYYYMFQGCTNLNYIKCLATNISGTNCTYNWVDSVAPTGTFVKASSMTSWTTGTNGIPNNWTVEDNA